MNSLEGLRVRSARYLAVYTRNHNKDRSDIQPANKCFSVQPTLSSFLDSAIPTFPFSNLGEDKRPPRTPEEVDNSRDRQELGDERSFFCVLLAENKPKQPFTTWSMTVRKKERRDQKVEKASL